MSRPSRLLPLCSCLLVVVLTGLLLPAPSVAQKESEGIRTADYDVRDLEYPDLRDFETPDPERVVLDNGLTVFLLEDHELPQVHAMARIGTGSVYESAEKRGLASVTGTVMRTGGTASMAPDSVNTTLENVGASVETGIGQTSGTAYMSTLADHVDTVFPVFAEVLQDPAFAEEKLQQAKSQQKSAISRRNDQARQIAFREFNKLVYGSDSPYARTPEYYTIDRIQRTDLEAFHDRFYHPRNVILSVWGDFDAGAMKERIRAQFGDWETAEDFSSPAPPTPTTSRDYSVNFIQKSDVTQSTILIGHPGSLRKKHPDYPAVTIMNEVLSGGFSGRLFQNVRREKGLAYAVFGRYTANFDRPGRFFTGVFSKSPSTVRATKAVLHEVRRMRTEPPTADELSLAKDSYLNSFVFNFDTKRDILSRLMTYEYYDYPRDFLQQTKNGIETVTADDVLSVGKKYLHPDDSHILVVGNRSQFSDSLSTLTKDGTVNEIDISIPTRPPGEERAEETVSAEAREAGRRALGKARETLGGDTFDTLEEMRTVASQTISRGGQSMTLDVTVTQSMSGKYRGEVQTPRGTMVMLVNGNEGTQTMGGESRSMSSKQIERRKAQLWRSIPFLLANLDREALVVEDQGTATVDNTEYRVVRVSPPVGDPYTLYLEPASLRPKRLSYTAMTRQGPKDATDVLGSYETVGGIQVPHRTVTYHDEEKAAETKIEKVVVNPDLQADVFEIDGQQSK